MELYHTKIAHEQKKKDYSKEKIINNNVRIILHLFLIQLYLSTFLSINNHDKKNNNNSKKNKNNKAIYHNKNSFNSKRLTVNQNRNKRFNISNEGEFKTTYSYNNKTTENNTKIGLKENIFARTFLKKYNKKTETIKNSSSFNNIDIYKCSNQNYSYSIENTINNLLIKRMSEISFGPLLHNKNGKKSKERKVNFINVNNYFNPQINIIKVNKLNETKKVNNKENKKEDYKNNFNINIKKKTDDFFYIKNLKIIQLWWKNINKIIKIQKNVRGFIFRMKLLKMLEKEEKITSNLFVFYIIIRKIINNCIIKKIKEYILSLKNEKNNNYIKKNIINNNKIIKNSREKNINKNNKLNKEIINVKDTTNSNNNNNKDINNEINGCKYFNIKRKTSVKNVESVTFSGIKANLSKKKVNIENKMDDDFFPKIKQSNTNNYLISKKKSFINNLNNIKFYNIENCDNINYNKKNKENIINSENNNTIRKIKKKILVKSRNIDSNKTNFSSNNIKNKNKIILTENSQFIFSTSRNINDISNYKTKNYNIINTERSNNPKTFKIVSNLITNNSIQDYKSKNIPKKTILIHKKKLKNSDLKKKNDINNKKNCFSLWKEKTNKEIIIKYLIKKNLYNNKEKTINDLNKNKNIIIHRNHMVINNNNIFQKFKKILLKKALGLLIKKIINKCTLYKYFLLFNHYTDKIKIFQKLKIYLIVKKKFNNKIYNNNQYIGIRTEKRKDKKDYFPITIPRRIKYKKKKIKKEELNLLSLSSSFSQNKKKFYINIHKNNYNNFNISNEYTPINNQKIKIKKSIYNNLFRKENNNKNKKNKDLNPFKLSSESNLIMQINQLKMIFNLLKLHNKKKISLINYFNKWKNNIKSKVNTINDNKIKMKNKIKLYQLDFNYDINFRNLSTKEKDKDNYSPLTIKNRNNSYKDKELFTKIKYQTNNKYNVNIKINNYNNINCNNNNFINMIYKKKLFNIGSRTSRNYINNDYLNLFEQSLNNDYLQKKNSYNNLYLNNKYINSNNQTLSSFSFGETFYKKRNTIEEKEIFFNRTVKSNNQINFTSYNNNNKNGFSINYYYKNIPKKRNTFYGSFYLNKKSRNRFNEKLFINNKNKNYNSNRTFDTIKKKYYYDFYIDLLNNRKNTL